MRWLLTLCFFAFYKIQKLMTDLEKSLITCQSIDRYSMTFYTNTFNAFRKLMKILGKKNVEDEKKS